MPPISLEQIDGIAHLILDRPPRNEMDRAFFAALESLTRDELPDLDVTGLICRGRGRHFSSGADVAQLKRRARTRGLPDLADELRSNSHAFHRIAELPYPTVAVVAGCCLGSGLELALACDLRLTAPHALLALPEAEFGLMPGCGGTVRLTEIVGTPRALELTLRGRSLGTDEALTLGVIDRIVPRKSLVPTAVALIHRLGADRPPSRSRCASC